MPDVSYSLAGFRESAIEVGLDAIAHAGFSCIELTGIGTSFADWHMDHGDVVPVPPTGRVAAEFRDQIARRGLRATTFHAPPRKNVLGAPTEDWRKEKVAVLGNYLRFAGEIGAAGDVMHGIPNPMFLPTGKDVATLVDPMVDAMQRSVADLVPVAAEAGVRMLLENLPYQRDIDIEYPLIRMQQLRPFVDDSPPAQVGLVVDTGHAWTNGDDPAREIEIAGDRLWGPPLQDGPLEDPNDNHWAPTAGDLDWPVICATLRRINYAGTWTFEVINGRHGETADELARQSRAAATAWGL